MIYQYNLFYPNNIKVPSLTTYLFAKSNSHTSSHITVQATSQLFINITSNNDIIYSQF